MKRILLLFSILTIMAYVSAQTEDYSKYLNSALEKLEAGDCDAAQKYYNVYKELVGKSVASVEVLLSECGGKEKTYKVGDYIKVGDEKYQVAYIRDGGKHGLAVLNKGWQAMSDKKDLYITRKGIPTMEEMKLIYSNRDIVRLYDIYWTCSRNTSSHSYYYYTYDFSTGKITEDDYAKSNGIILLIHRF